MPEKPVPESDGVPPPPHLKPADHFFCSAGAIPSNGVFGWEWDGRAPGNLQTVGTALLLEPGARPALRGSAGWEGSSPSLPGCSGIFPRLAPAHTLVHWFIGWPVPLCVVSHFSDLGSGR